MHQAVACAEARRHAHLAVRRPHPRLAQEVRRASESYAPAEDPGVVCVTKIYNYYKKHGHKTEVMGASFRNIGEITELAGCDLLTIAPNLLAELADGDGDAPAQARPRAGRSRCDIAEVAIDEATFRKMHEADKMANDKLDEGIEGFIEGARRAREAAGERLAALEGQDGRGDAAREFFEVYDLDGDGFITREEWGGAHRVRRARRQRRRPHLDHRARRRARRGVPAREVIARSVTLCLVLAACEHGSSGVAERRDPVVLGVPADARVVADAVTVSATEPPTLPVPPQPDADTNGKALDQITNKNPLNGALRKFTGTTKGTLVMASSTTNDIDRKIKEHAGLFKACYTRELAKGRDLGGKVKLSFTVSGTGTVTKATATGMDPTVEDCLVRVVKQIKFEASADGKPANITYPLLFSSP